VIDIEIMSKILLIDSYRQEEHEFNEKVPRRFWRILWQKERNPLIIKKFERLNYSFVSL
jgi:hypothetical protein